MLQYVIWKQGYKIGPLPTLLYVQYIYNSKKYRTMLRIFISGPLQEMPLKLTKYNKHGQHLTKQDRLDLFTFNTMMLVLGICCAVLCCIALFAVFENKHIPANQVIFINSILTNLKDLATRASCMHGRVEEFLKKKPALGKLWQIVIGLRVQNFTLKCFFNMAQRFRIYVYWLLL